MLPRRGQLWTHQHPVAHTYVHVHTRTHTLTWALGLCVCSSLPRSRLRACVAQSGDGGPDVVWRWQRGPAALGRHGSLGTAHGQAAPRRRLPSTRSLPSCLSSASWGCWASWCVTCSSGRATTALPTRKSGLALELEAVVRPGLGSCGEARGHGPGQPSLEATQGHLRGLEGLTGKGLQRADREGFLEVLHVGHGGGHCKLTRWKEG